MQQAPAVDAAFVAVDASPECSLSVCCFVDDLVRQALFPQAVRRPGKILHHLLISDHTLHKTFFLLPSLWIMQLQPCGCEGQNAACCMAELIHSSYQKAKEVSNKLNRFYMSDKLDWFHIIAHNIKAISGFTELSDDFRQ